MMRFREDGTFHIIQFADVQEIPEVAEDTLLLMCRSLDKARPDLVVFSGDQLKGYSRKFRKGKEEAEKTIRRILEPVTSRGIPFAVTFGNHDRQCGMSNEEQMNIYRGIPGCVDWLNSRGEEIYHGPREGTFALGIRSRDEERTAMAVYMIDSGGNLPGGGCYTLHPGDIFWYKGVRDALAEKNGGPVPGIVFQHIPLPEYYRLLRRTGRRNKNAIRAYRTHAGEYYVLNQKKCREGTMGESVSIPDKNAGEYESFREAGDIFAVFCGHDHRNSFVGNCGGIDLGYTPSCGFHEYGSGVDRGVREFVFRQEDPAAYETRLLTYRELVGARAQRPVKDFWYRIYPSSREEAVEKLKWFFLYGGAAFLAAGAGRLRRRWQGKK